MKRDDAIRLLAEHRQEFARFGVKSLALFGSVARNESRPETDIDVLVEFEGRAAFDRYMELKFFLEDLLGCQVDLVTNKALKPRLRPYVGKEAVHVIKTGYGDYTQKRHEWLDQYTVEEISREIQRHCDAA
jgi:predicted nucleotidyltransferase